MALAISLRLGLWRQNSPGEGLFPFLTALAMTGVQRRRARRVIGTRSSARKTSDRGRRPQRPDPGRGLSRRADLLCRGARVPRASSSRPLSWSSSSCASPSAIRWLHDAGADRRHGRSAARCCSSLARRDPAGRHRCGTVCSSDRAAWSMAWTLQSIALGFATALTWQNLDLLLRRHLRRHGGRRAAGARAGADDLAAAAVLVHDGRRLGRHPDGRHLLRRAVRRLDHRHPGAHSRARPPPSSPASTATPWRARAAPARRSASPPSAPSSPACIVTIALFVVGPALAGRRAGVRTRGIHRAGAARPAAGHAAVLGLADQRAADGGVRPPALDRRQGPDLRHRALHLRHLHACSTGSTSRCWRWACSASPSC